MLDFIHNYSSVPYLCRSYANGIKDAMATRRHHRINFQDLAAVALCSKPGASGVHTHRIKYEPFYAQLVNTYIDKSPLIATGSTFSDALLKIQISGEWYYIHPLGYVELTFSQEIEQQLWQAIDYILNYYSIHELATIEYDWCQDRTWWHEMMSTPCVDGVPVIPPSWRAYLPYLPTLEHLQEGPCYL